MEVLLLVPCCCFRRPRRPLYSTLTGMAKDVTSLLARYRAASREVSTEAVTAHRNIDAARKQLKAALADHVTACRGFESVLAERRRRHF